MVLKDDDELFNKLMELVHNDPKRFYVVETQVDVETQLEYFEVSADVRKAENVPDFNDLVLLVQNGKSDDEIKKSLVILAGMGEVEAFRYIETYLLMAPEHLKSWALMAYQEAKLLLETTLLEESRVFISSAMGGKDYRLRYSVAFVSENMAELSEFQQGIIEKEVMYFFQKNDSTLEKIDFEANVVKMLCLIPIQMNLQTLFDEIISEINQFGGFLSENYLITNEKHLSDDDILKFCSDIEK